LLPRLLEQIGVEELDHGHDQVRGGDHDQDPGPPGAKAGEKAPEVAQRFMGPDVDGALAWEHEAELPGDDRARDQEGEKAEDPVDETGRPGGLDDGPLVGEQDDGDEDGDHVERPENLG
jgi:hypothetical protein